MIQIIVIMGNLIGTSQSCKENNNLVYDHNQQPPPPVDLQRSQNVRASIRTKQPMPDQNELERKFAKVLVSFRVVIPDFKLNNM